MTLQPSAASKTVWSSNSYDYNVTHEHAPNMLTFR